MQANNGLLHLGLWIGAWCVVDLIGCSADGDPRDPDMPKAQPAWVQAASMPPRPMGRGVHGMAFDPHTKTTWLVGGQSIGPLPIGDLWSFREDVWQMVLTRTDLPARKNFGIAYDTGRHRLVVFGGIVGGLVVTPTFLNDTWELVDGNWVQRSTASTPSPRSGQAMAFDEARGRVVLFGGGSDSPQGDTWEYDGEEWQQMHPAVSPPARYNARLAYDSLRQRVLLFGGQDGDSFADLWTWDGANWVELGSVGPTPPGRGFFAMTYDRGRDRLVIQGGTTAYPPYINSSNTFADQWEFNGSSWEEVAFADGPGKRSGHAMVYDQQRERLVLFGGVRNGEDLLDDTWEHYGCTIGEQRCVGTASVLCGYAGFGVNDDCASRGLECHQLGEEARCEVGNGCATHVSEEALARYDTDIFGTYLIVSGGPVGPDLFDGIQLNHRGDVGPVESLLDPRITDAPGIVLFAWRGETLFAATSGTINFAVLGREETDIYYVELTHLTFVEAALGADGVEYPAGGEEECMDQLSLQTVVVRYFCRNLDPALRIGGFACAEHDGDSLLVRCEEGMVQGSSGNLGRLVLETNCSMTGQVCVADGVDTPSCQPSP